MAMPGKVNQGVLVVIVAICAVLAYWAIRFATQDEESRLRKLIYSAVVMVEREDIDKCGLLMSPDYQDSYGNNKKEILDLIKKTFRDFHNLKVDIKNIKIEIDGPGAKASIGFMACFKVKDGEQFYYDTGKLGLSFKKQKSLWKIFSIEYVSLNELLFMEAVA